MLNKVTLIGNLGSDPDIHYTADNIPIVNVSLATSRKWKDKKTGEIKEQTEWHRIVFFNRLAEIAKEYIGKGQQIYVEGRLQTKVWKNKSNEDRYTTEIVAEELKMLGKRNNNMAANKSIERDPVPMGNDKDFDPLGDIPF